MYVAGDHFFFMRRRPPRSTRPDTLFPYPTRVRSRLWLARPPREGQMSPSHSARRQALARFAANRAAMVGLVLLTVIVLLRSEEHTSELQSLMRTSSAVFCLKQKTTSPLYLHNNLSIIKTTASHTINKKPHVY